MKYFWLISALVFSCFIFGSYFWYQQSQKPVSTSPDLKSFIINPGDPASLVIKKLADEKFVRSYYAGRIFQKIKQTVFRPGVYYLSPDKNLSEQFLTLQKGPTDIRVSFPEGWRREQYAQRLKSTFPEFDADLFLRLTATLEGQLFPDTYYFPASPSPKKVLSIITANFAKKSGLSPSQKDILIIASLIERESNNPNDSGYISGILHKRLKNNWPLQIDATVQYAKDTDNFKFQISNFKFWSPIYDTKFESPYNTYLYPGLPPSPIANPGANSINAALNPVFSDYWYYLTGNDGVTYFSKDLQNHQLLIDTKLKP